MAILHTVSALWCLGRAVIRHRFGWLIWSVPFVMLAIQRWAGVMGLEPPHRPLGYLIIHACFLLGLLFTTRETDCRTCPFYEQRKILEGKS